MKIIKIVYLITKQQIKQIIQLDQISTILQSWKQNKLALNSFDDKRLYINNTQSVPWDIHTQKGDCTCILCIKFIGLYYKELTFGLTDEKFYYNVWYWKEFYTQNQLIQAINLKLQEKIFKLYVAIKYYIFKLYAKL